MTSIEDQELLDNLDMNSNNIVYKYELLSEFEEMGSDLGQEGSPQKTLNDMKDRLEKQDAYLTQQQMELESLTSSPPTSGRAKTGGRNMKRDLISPSDLDHKNYVKHNNQGEPMLSNEEEEEVESEHEKSAFFAETMSFINENIEKHNDPSENQINDYITMLLQKETTKMNTPEKKVDQSPYRSGSESYQPLGAARSSMDPNHSIHQSPLYKRSPEDRKDSLKLTPRKQYGVWAPEPQESPKKQHASSKRDSPKRNTPPKRSTPKRRTPKRSTPKKTRSETKKTSSSFYTNLHKTETISSARRRKLTKRKSKKSPKSKKTRWNVEYQRQQEPLQPLRSNNPLDEIVDNLDNTPHKRNMHANTPLSPTASGVTRSSRAILRSVLHSTEAPSKILSPEKQDVIIDDDVVDDIQIPKPPSNSSNEEQLIYYLKYLSNESHLVRFDAVKNLRELLNDISAHETAESQTTLELHLSIVDELIRILHSYVKYDEAFNRIVIETLACIGVNAAKSIELLIELLKDPHQYALYETILSCVFAIGRTGLEALVESASNAQSPWDAFVLTHIANHPVVQKEVIVPSLLRELRSSSDSRKRSGAVAALKHLGVRAKTCLATFLEALIQGSLDRKLVAEAIRALGPQGSQMLTFFITQNHNARIRSCAAAAFGASLPSGDLRVLVNTDIRSFEDVPQTNIQFNDKHSFLVYDARELLMAIRRCFIDGVFNDLPLYTIKNKQLTAFFVKFAKISSKTPVFPNALNASNSSFISTDHADNRGSLELMKQSFQSEQHYKPQRLRKPTNIDEETIQALSAACRDADATVRMAAVRSLGNIGIPAALPALNAMIGCLDDSSNKVRASTITSMGKLTQNFDATYHEALIISILEHIPARLKDTFYNVRRATLFTIRRFGKLIGLDPPIEAKIIESLIKIIEDGSINRNETAETIMYCGERGTLRLLDLLRRETRYNSVIRIAIIHSLALTSVNSHSLIDEVVDCLFSASRDRVPLVRQQVLSTLGQLATRAEERVTYLRSQSLLPFLYSFLKDPERCVRDMASKVLAHTGPRGELVLVEGVLQDGHAVIRAAAGYGLRFVGPKCIRTLLLALNDKDPHVCRAVGQSIEAIGVSNIINSLRDRSPQVRESVLSSCREILSIIGLVPNSTSLSKTLNKLEKAIQHFDN